MDNSISNECAVKIAVRERPLSAEEIKTDEESVVEVHSSNQNILIVDDRPFVFDHVLGPECNQKFVYDELIAPLVSKMLQGFHCTVLAYGQTGTGKTYTMGLHGDGCNEQNSGMISQTITDICQRVNAMQEASENHAKTELSVSFIEIYNEKVYDLLSKNYTEFVNLKDYKTNGGTKNLVKTPSDAYDALVEGNKNRHVRPTKMNLSSSRSHAIFTIYASIRKTNSHIIKSALHLVDLAGSEGVRRTGHQGPALVEGVNINQGLLTVGRILQAISAGEKVIPYRDSVLTMVLQDSLNRNCYLTLLACISPSKLDMSETLSTLRFAKSAKSVKNNPQINLIITEIQNARRKTPTKSAHTPRKRPSMTPLKNPPTTIKKKPLAINNTFCTPGKNTLKRVDQCKLNQSVILGLQSKAARTFKIPPPVPPFDCYNGIASATITHSEKSQRNRNESIDSRFSTYSNFSTSTNIDHPPSISPVIRRCMEGLEAKIDEKIQSMMQSFSQSINQTIVQTPMQPISRNSSTPNNQDDRKQILDNQTTPVVSSKNVSWRTIKQELQDIVRSEISMLQSLPGQSTVFSTPAVFTTDNKSKYQLSTNTTPIFKMPEIPHHRFFPEESVLLDGTGMDDTFVLRRRGSPNEDLQSSDISSQTNNNQLMAGDKIELGKRTRRQSARIATQRSTEIVTDGNVTMGGPVRRSLRLSMISSHRNQTINDVPRHNVEKVQRKVIKKKLENVYLAEYFQSNKNNLCSKTSPQTAKRRHKQEILKILNTGNIKELQFLPQIGVKTAFQIMTHRTLNGKFKNLSNVSKLPVWRGKGWSRFEQANNLI